MLEELVGWSHGTRLRLKVADYNLDAIRKTWLNIKLSDVVEFARSK